MSVRYMNIFRIQEQRHDKYVFYSSVKRWKRKLGSKKTIIVVLWEQLAIEEYLEAFIQFLKYNIYFGRH